MLLQLGISDLGTAVFNTLIMKYKIKLTKEESAYLNLILYRTSKITGISVQSITSKHRKREKVVARQLYCYLAFTYRTNKSMSMSKIASMLGQDHSTCLYSIKEIKKFIGIENSEITVPLAKLDLYRTFIINYTLIYEDIDLIKILQTGNTITFNLLHENYTYKTIQ